MTSVDNEMHGKWLQSVQFILLFQPFLVPKSCLTSFSDCCFINMSVEVWILRWSTGQRAEAYWQIQVQENVSRSTLKPLMSDFSVIKSTNFPVCGNLLMLLIKHSNLVEIRRELSDLIDSSVLRWMCASSSSQLSLLYCENVTRRLTELSLLRVCSSTNTQTKMPLYGLSPALTISGNRHCLCFPPAVYFQNDYCMVHTIC